MRYVLVTIFHMLNMYPTPSMLGIMVEIGERINSIMLVR